MENIKKGKLKIFFGYSAGVGKTYAMLKVAKELYQDGVDIVIGYIEPHDRPDTIKLTENLPTLPLKVLQYKGIEIKEFDIDEAIKRKPKLILIDELAHTNAVGSKNKKRYLDVEELLNNGIDVWTTVNVQHIEGLHDIVDSATSVDVTERIPDKIFDIADEVVLIDIEPADLIERMLEGKIYHKTQAKLALENFFNTENLLSLRELFLRRGADRIEKLNTFGNRTTRILVLISPSPSSAKNLRFAARMAEAYHCKYSAMYVETHGQLDDESAANLKKHMRLVNDTGGEMIVKYGDDVVETVADYVKISGITDLIIGKTWQSIGKKVGLEDRLISRLPALAIIIIPDKQTNRIHRQKNRLFTFLFKRKKLQEQFRSSNKTLDIINLLAKSANDKDHKIDLEKITEILGTAFERTCKIISNRGEGVFLWQKEDASLFDNTNEQAVAEWCKKNGKTAGSGTESLCGAKAIYFPILVNNLTIAVIALSCLRSKMTISEKILFHQLNPILGMILNCQSF